MLKRFTLMPSGWFSKVVQLIQDSACLSTRVQVGSFLKKWIWWRFKCYQSSLFRKRTLCQKPTNNRSPPLHFSSTFSTNWPPYTDGNTNTNTQMEIETHTKIQTQIWNTDTKIHLQLQKDISGLTACMLKQGNFDEPGNYYWKRLRVVADIKHWGN